VGPAAASRIERASRDALERTPAACALRLKRTSASARSNWAGATTLSFQTRSALTWAAAAGDGTSSKTASTEGAIILIMGRAARPLMLPFLAP